MSTLTAITTRCASADPRAARRAHHRPHRRAVPQKLAPAEAGGERVAVHLRGAGRGRHTTLAEHMPSSHRRHAEWTIERIGREAAAIGPSTAKLAELILARGRPYRSQATKSRTTSRTHTDVIATLFSTWARATRRRRRTRYIGNASCRCYPLSLVLRSARETWSPRILGNGRPASGAFGGNGPCRLSPRMT
jgi:hypothetical protein